MHQYMQQSEVEQQLPRRWLCLSVRLSITLG